jgi:hypothetical protein
MNNNMKAHIIGGLFPPPHAPPPLPCGSAKRGAGRRVINAHFLAASCQKVSKENLSPLSLSGRGAGGEGKFWRKIALLLLLVFLCACQAAPAAPDLKATAYAEATQISVQGEATAIVLAARVTTNARLQQISGATATPIAPTSTLQTIQVSQPLAVSAPDLPSPTSLPIQAVSPTSVEVLGVSFGAEGTLIMVQFTASPKVAQNWFQGSVSVTDEASGAVYEEISVAPLIGPLISRPREEGRPGYAMLTNSAPGLKGGELVTVRLGDYRFEHVRVKSQ